jgi:hypothetical protein
MHAEIRVTEDYKTLNPTMGYSNDTVTENCLD